MRRILSAVAVPAAVAALALAAGCGGGAPDETPGAPAAPAAAAEAPAAPPEGTDSADPVPAPAPTAATVARSDADVAVFDEPGATEPSTILPARTEFGSPRALLVVAEEGDWLQVALPVRPNGTTGWVHRDGLELRTVSHSIVVDLTARTLTILDAGVPVLTTPVAVGTAENPTPVGAFFVVDKLDTGDPTGPYGRYAIGVSAHSDTITDFAGGDGQVGIHGTDDPSSIGQAASHGCIRVPADVAQTLADTIDLGTPVLVS